MPSPSRCPPGRLHVEELETRLTPSGLQPTPIEQEFLERLNDARANPAAYGASISLNLTGVRRAPPLAFDTRLIAAARGHSQDMASRGYFAHFTPEGVGPQQRIRAAGFPAPGSEESIDMAQIPTFAFDPSSPTGLGARQFYPPEAALADLIIDSGVPDLGHRKQLLALDGFSRQQTLVGVGYAFHDLTDTTGFPFTDHFYTIDESFTAQHQAYLTGCVFRDANHNGLYDAGEGLAGVRIKVSGQRGVQDFDSGGYTVAIRHPGTYRVTASGGALGVAVTEVVHVGGHNARLNFIVP
jgi:uncharacterized protein YkwD